MAAQQPHLSIDNIIQPSLHIVNKNSLIFERAFLRETLTGITGTYTTGFIAPL